MPTATTPTQQCSKRQTVSTTHFRLTLTTFLFLFSLLGKPGQCFVCSPPAVHHHVAPHHAEPCSLAMDESHHQHYSRLLLRNKDDENDNDKDLWAHNRARTDIRNFLTQRAIQSFMYLLINCRDQATVQWLENTYQLQNMARYHGTAGLNLTAYPEWDSLLMDLVLQPPSVVVIRAKRRGRGHGGWSKNNPYLEERFVEFEIDIEPTSLVSRIISVREQIAGEWVADLQTLRDVNEMILDAYYESQDAQRKVTDDDEPESYEEKLKANAEKKAYDRGAMMVLGNHIASDGKASSPFRKGSFDLLGLLATQESIHRVLRSYRNAGDEREVSFLWLLDFYIQRIASHFDGAQEYGRADDFLGELLLTAPSMKQLGNTMGLIDPYRIAEDIITMRSLVAQEWRDTVAEVLRKDHEDLRRSITAAQMDRRLDETTQFVSEQTSFYDQGFQ